jgi:hypothetical protein
MLALLSVNVLMDGHIARVAASYDAMDTSTCELDDSKRGRTSVCTRRIYGVGGWRERRVRRRVRLRGRGPVRAQLRGAGVWRRAAQIDSLLYGDADGDTNARRGLVPGRVWAWLARMFSVSAPETPSEPIGGIVTQRICAATAATARTALSLPMSMQ